MRKLSILFVIMFAVTLAITSVTSCAVKPDASTADSTNTTILVDTTQVDTTAVDTTLVK